MKKQLIITFILLPILCFSQNLKVYDKENQALAHEFKPGDRVFLLTKDIKPLQTGIFEKATKDSVFFSHNSFAMAEIENIVRDRELNYAMYFLCSGVEMVGFGFQTVGAGFWYFSGFETYYKLENISFAALIGSYFYFQGVVIKWIGRELKSDLFSISKYSYRNYNFISG